jgi:hypothetical protein
MTLEEAVAYAFDNSEIPDVDLSARGDPQASLH